MPFRAAHARLALAALTLAAPVLLFLQRAFARRWMSDDGFINLRVVRNLLEGHGPVFNIGERVESYTSVLWIGILAVCGQLGLRLEHAAVYGGLLLAVAGLALATAGAMTAYGMRLSDVWRNRILPLGALVYAVIPPAWDHATAGLETGLSLFWLGGAFFLMMRLVTRHEAGERLSNLALAARAFWLSFGPLVRPELALVALGMLTLLALHLLAERRERPFLPRLAMLAAAGGLVPIGHQIFRMGYFAAMTPNTAIAKEAFRSRWDQGWLFFDNFFGLYNLLMPLAVLALVLIGTWFERAGTVRWRRTATLFVPMACGIAYVLYVVRVGGGFMHGRLFLPAVFCFLMPMAVLPLRDPQRDVVPLWRRAALVLVLFWATVTFGWTRVDRENEHGIGDERGWYTREAGVRNPVRIEDYDRFYFHKDAIYLLDRAAERCPEGHDTLRSGDATACDRFVFVDNPHYGRLEPHRSHLPLDRERVSDSSAMVAQRIAIGIGGFVMGPSVHLVDHVGLADPLAARMELGARGRPGHEKSLSNTWLVARYGAPDATPDPGVAAARRALACGELAELMDAVSGPITFDEFLTNLGRARRLQNLRVPLDPFTAEQRFCGTR